MPKPSLAWGCSPHAVRLQECHAEQFYSSFGALLPPAADAHPNSPIAQRGFSSRSPQAFWKPEFSNTNVPEDIQFSITGLIY